MKFLDFFQYRFFFNWVLPVICQQHWHVQQRRPHVQQQQLGARQRGHRYVQRPERGQDAVGISGRGEPGKKYT